MMPTADHVACAIVAAARVTGEDAERCFEKPAKPVRCRYYALALLAEQFAGCSKAALGVFVGYRRAAGAVVLCSGPPGHFDQQAAAAILAAYLQLIERHVSKPASEPAAPKLLALPAPSKPQRTATPAPGKRGLYEMLARAVANTPGAKPASEPAS